MSTDKNNEQVVNKEGVTVNEEQKTDKEKPTGKKKCGKSECDEEVVSSRTYCSKYHNKHEIILDHLRRYEEEKDQFGIELCQGFLNSSGKNSLQPKGKISVPPACTGANTLSEFAQQFWDKYGDALLAMAGAKTLKPNRRRHTDLEKRAEAVAELLVKGKFKTLRLMDGHGRILFLILRHLIARKEEDFVNSLEIELVDTDAGVHAYHKGAFVGKGCENIKAICKDILDMKISPTTLVYLNFCGIIHSIEKAEAFCEKYEKKQISFVLSFSTRNIENSEPISNLKKALDIVFIKLETGRNNFLTYMFNPAIPPENQQIPTSKIVPKDSSATVGQNDVSKTPLPEPPSNRSTRPLATGCNNMLIIFFEVFFGTYESNNLQKRKVHK
ncbi:hypothetical protein RFI_00283 [Reticulomyxa filosa]|uniref:Uncharacterized protein n=1 Tax=Reticulomyxa filosa TaxID=46433 RepID=X6PGG6_RETFI|nr:hypothetical protein RFI_00283 [Reticulomyxa filosa]|eukprot:ETO36782.1 hypothetical protein RFI_00283 [Reticulomyxa filosa]